MAPSPKPSALFRQDCKEFGKSLRSWKGIATILFSVGPMAGILIPDQLPPWPSAVAWAAVIPLLTPLAILCVFREMSPNATWRWAIGFLIGGFAGTVVYVYAVSTHVVEIDNESYIVGARLTQEAQEAIEKGKVRDTPRDLLDYFARTNADAVWEDLRMYIASLALSFYVTAAAFAGGFSAFIVRMIVLNRSATS